MVVIMGAEAYAMSLMSHATFGKLFRSLSFAQLNKSIWFVPCSCCQLSQFVQQLELCSIGQFNLVRALLVGAEE
jgi:hypothetical protein